jgi:rhodanese-related sulfurtransferase
MRNICVRIALEVIEIGLLHVLFGKDYQEVKYEEIVEMLQEKSKYQFIDMRTKQEYNQGHAQGFNKNIDYYKARRSPALLKRINKNKPVVLMCASGVRSRGTCKMLVKMGYEEVYNYKGGLRAWNGTLIK